MGRNDSPLPPAAFFVLFSLAGGDKHGYAIMKEARSLSEERVQLGPATLYTTIQRLLDSGHIREVTGNQSDDSRRRYYSLTASGRVAVQNEVRLMEAIVRKSRSMRLQSAEAAS